MKSFFITWFFGRGVSWLSEATSKIVRHGIGVYGGVLMGQELATQGQIDSIEGGALAIGAVAWSALRIYGPKILARFL